jgi:hypothetical protein
VRSQAAADPALGGDEQNRARIAAIVVAARVRRQ